MKNLFLSLFAITTIIFSAKAQENNTGKSKNSIEQKKNEHRHGKFDHEQMAGKLNFTDEQKQQLKSINEDFKNKMQELDNNNNITAEELKEKRHALGKEKMEKAQALLTPDQKNQMQKFRKERKDRGKMDGTKKMEKMKSTLNLSDEQIEKMNVQREEFKSKEKAIRNNDSLTADKKDEQLKSLRDERKNSFKSFLTPEQVKKLEQMKHNKPAKNA